MFSTEKMMQHVTSGVSPTGYMDLLDVWVHLSIEKGPSVISVMETVRVKAGTIQSLQKAHDAALYEVTKRVQLLYDACNEDETLDQKLPAK